MNLDELKVQPDLHEEVRCTLYIAGPMTGHPGYNIPAFDDAAAVLRERGYPVISPAELDEPEVRAACLASKTGDDVTIPGYSWEQCLARDIEIVARVDAIAALPGWETSRGAVFEIAVALKLGKTVYGYEPGAATLWHMALTPTITVCPV